MHLPPLSSPVLSGYYSSGDVSIAGDVVMGSGVILRANPGYSIRIQAGVCLGLGVILHASEGNIIVAAGAILGAGALVVGWAEIGQRACIGSAVTLMNVSIAPGQMVAPGSLLGHWGRRPDPESVNDRPSDRGQPHPVPGSFSLGNPHGHSQGDPEDPVPFPSPGVSNSRDPSVEAKAYSTAGSSTATSSTVGNSTVGNSRIDTGSPAESVPAPEPKPESAPKSEPKVEPVSASDPPASSPPEAPPKTPSVVYGKDYFLQMRFAMFPHHS
jgi:carbon dioxide concentrating mechanism protein CcmN